MQKLPVGMQNFESIRKQGFLYVDKTQRIVDLVENGTRYFLSRPRRFGKSLTLSTIEAMFQGKTELFKGLYAEQWVRSQSSNPRTVLHIDMSGISGYKNDEEFEKSFISYLKDYTYINDIDVKERSDAGDFLRSIILNLYKNHGEIVVLIDEYDKPILDNIANIENAKMMRDKLHSIYTIVKNCDKYIYFLFITGISKFSKAGVFSAMNNLLDISFANEYSDIVGYTQKELEEYFAEWIENTANSLKVKPSEVLSGLKKYYDGFSFDGHTRLYNPFSILCYFRLKRYANYWYDSGSPSFVIEWMKIHGVKNPEKLRHIEMNSSFISSHDIENADVSSFLYQSGYLTIEKINENILTLDFPNKEVLESISIMYLSDIYSIKDCVEIGNNIWGALRKGDIQRIVDFFNVALSELPYDGLEDQINEYFFRALFLMLLRCVGVIAYAEVHTFKGRSDIVIQLETQIVVIEFKFAPTSAEVDSKRKEGAAQILSRNYAKPYGGGSRKVSAFVVVADGQLRQAVL